MNTVVTLDTEFDDTANFFDLIANPTRLTYPYTGLFLVVTGLVFVANATGQRRAGLERNGGGIPDADDRRAAYGESGLGTTLTFSMITPKIAGDFHELFVFQNSGGALDLGFAKISVVTLRDDS